MIPLLAIAALVAIPVAFGIWLFMKDSEHHKRKLREYEEAKGDLRKLIALGERDGHLRRKR